MAAVTYDDIQAARVAMDLALDPLRALVHEICKQSGAEKNCPYKKLVDIGEMLPCASCQFNKEN
jgi:hypothetical protein